ncbi:hypothetical protein ACO2Q7_13755 [Rathayibacter sp. KR2-224]|uniref:DUF7882 family protein n=1 Tax=Rathayibacter sp. KR2-224 TaxID=3400913 RepID=UPI003C08C833
MATFNYNNMLQAEFDDRTLAHLERVIVGKMRRREAFHFAWTTPEGERKSVWLDSGVAVSFDYAHPVRDFNRTWLERLMSSASSAAGLTVLPEPEEEVQVESRQSRRAGLIAA